MSDDMGTMPIPELIAGMCEKAGEAFNKGGMVDGLVLNVLANRLEEQHTENERLEGLLSQVWDISRDNHLDFGYRIDKITKTIREKPESPSAARK